MIDKTESEQNKTIESAVGGADRFAGVLAKRRRFVTGGLAAAPILASMEVRNALAVDCLTPSGNLSGHVSHTQGIGSCAGLSVSCWDSRNPSQWPGGIANNRFHDIFAAGANANFGNDNLNKVVGYTGVT